jgi:hypothetical protein
MSELGEFGIERPIRRSDPPKPRLRRGKPTGAEELARSPSSGPQRFPSSEFWYIGAL